MYKISSKIKSLDSLIDSFYIGDNVVWEVEAGTNYDLFIRNFIKQSFIDNHGLIYINFNRSPQSILNNICDFIKKIASYCSTVSLLVKVKMIAGF